MHMENSRIGLVVGTITDPFWVQMLEGIYETAERSGIHLTALNEALPYFSNDLEETAFFEELRLQNFTVVIGWGVPNTVVERALDAGIYIIHLNETRVRHPLSISPIGLYDAAQVAAHHIAALLNGRGNVLQAGGITASRREELGTSRVQGFRDALKNYPQITLHHLSCYWTYEEAYESTRAYLDQTPIAFDALFGISDTQAMAMRDAAQTLGLLGPQTHVVGINGDPFALAAVASGKMAATVETSAIDMGRDALEIAYRIVRGLPVQATYPFKIRLVTPQNVNQVSAEKLYAIAEMPNRLVGFNRQIQQDRLLQLETSLQINRRVGSILDFKQLSHEIADLIRVNYGYDAVRLFVWMPVEQIFMPYGQGGAQRCDAIPLQRAGLLAEALQRGEPAYIPDTRMGGGTVLEAEWAEMRSRVALPIRLGEQISWVLDLYSRQPMTHLRQDLVGLQSLADQLGIAMRNAELYDEAVKARAAAEAADRLKTRLLANVSHELRTPLNIIMGYSQSALSSPNSYGVDLPAGLRRDLEYILQSGEHLYRMINDLLDLSRAEIGALDLELEVVEPAPLLQQAFESYVNSIPKQKTVVWKQEIPPRLPLIHADPVRLRQIVLNLLHNASKFTAQGQIVLGAEVEPPYLHLWVQDTGAGIPIAQQERIFEPFVTASQTARRAEGVGLGLTITRRLVALHGGTMLLQSQPGQGSIFHAYLPLPDLSGEQTSTAASRPDDTSVENRHSVVVVISGHGAIPPEIEILASRQHAEIQWLPPGENIESWSANVQPVALAWDMGSAAGRQSTSREWSLIQRLRRHAHCMHLPFLVYNGQSSEQDSQPGMGGLTNVVLKPITARSLKEILESLHTTVSCRPVWIVDDDAEARALYQRLATEIFPEIEILTAADGIRALKLLGQVQSPEQAPSLVLLDLLMPQVDGFQVLDALRANPLTQRVPVIVLSGKVLTFEDVQRLDHAQVLFQPKHILSPEETQKALQQTIQGDSGLSQPTSALARHALAYLQQNYAQALSRAEIARAVGVTENYLTQIFRQEVGLTPWECLSRLRIHKACELLRTNQASITAIASQVGFDDSAYFSRVFRKQMGVSPQQYRSL